ncbi:TPA: hypothetical protein ACJKBI_000423 [Neisseria meningitidis]
MPSETGNRVSDGILFVISKRGSLNIPTLFLPFWGRQNIYRSNRSKPVSQVAHALFEVGE